MMTQISNMWPVLSTLSPVTMAGIAVVAGSSIFYLFSRAPEFLMIGVTAIMYAATPLIFWH